MAAVVTEGTQKEPAKAPGTDTAHRPLAKRREGELPHWPGAPTPADGVQALFPIISLAWPGSAEPRCLLPEALCKDPRHSTASSPCRSTHARPLCLRGAPQAASGPGLGQPAGPGRRAERWPGRRSQAQRVRSGCRITQPRWVQAQTKGSESAGSTYVSAVALHWVKDRGDGDGDGEAAAAAGAGGACPARLLTRLQRRDLCVLPCPYVTARKYSQEGVTSSKG